MEGRMHMRREEVRGREQERITRRAGEKERRGIEEEVKQGGRERERRR
jgi:hypothetical protein